jgi:hypothetical protein
MSEQPTIAVLGASPDRSKFGNKCVRAFLDEGYEVFPINLGGSEVEGLVTYRRLDEVPKALDCISVYLPPPVSLELIPEIAAAGAEKVWFNPGAADGRVFEAARQAGVRALDACSIVAIGRSPAQYP